jgi:hypothetical protein
MPVQQIDGMDTGSAPLAAAKNSSMIPMTKAVFYRHRFWLSHMGHSVAHPSRCDSFARCGIFLGLGCGRFAITRNVSCVARNVHA